MAVKGVAVGEGGGVSSSAGRLCHPWCLNLGWGLFDLSIAAGFRVSSRHLIPETSDHEFAIVATMAIVRM